MFYKVFIFIFLLTVSLNVFANDIKDNIIPSMSGISEPTADDGLDFLDDLTFFLRDSIFGVLMVISIGMFLFIGARLALARGNPEEFKKALKAFIYSIVGLAIVFLSWAIVKLVIGIDI